MASSSITYYLQHCSEMLTFCEIKQTIGIVVRFFFSCLKSLYLSLGNRREGKYRELALSSDCATLQTLYWSGTLRIVIFFFFKLELVLLYSLMP